MTRGPATVVVAALGDGGDSVPVLETALRVAELTGAVVEAVYVEPEEGHHEAHEGETVSAADTSVEPARVPLRRLRGPMPDTLVAAVEVPEVLVSVLGARADSGGERRIGSTALYVLEHSTKPVVVVPPGARPGTIKTALIPLEGTEASSRPVLEGLWKVLGGDLEVVVLHVFTEESRPPMLDRPLRDLELLGREFLHRHLPRTERIELRYGPVAGCVADVARELAIDVIVLSWSQDSSEGRAAVVREVLESSTLPVLLLPIGTASAGTPSGRDQSP